ncbi:MAG TPA: adenine deaminase, partial [Anaerolineaceae bacterium]|nr:adenine deaminase [Anaerolineaceae bacterium]
MYIDQKLIHTALRRTPADLVIKGGRLVNVYTHSIYNADVAISGSRIAAIGDCKDCIGPSTQIVDADGLFLVPGLIQFLFHL